MTTPADPPATDADRLVHDLQAIAIDFAGDHQVDNTCRAAADLIERQAREIAALKATLQRQAAAALRGMDAAKAISSGQLKEARRLHAESNPTALDSERAANAALTERADRAEAERDAMRECVRELVACADESDSLAAERLYGKPHTPEYKTRELDHRQRSIEAWKAARAKVRT